jgi:pimeloyl-ACP methyl ester carboxylesterase
MLADVHARLFTENVEEKRRLIHALLGEMESPRLESAAVRQPTLVITGEHDAIFPVDLSRRLVSRLGPVARLAVLRRTAHAPNMERIGAYNRVLLDFLGARH